MVVGVRACGAYITRTVPIGLTVGAVFTILVSCVCFGVYGSVGDCYSFDFNDLDYYDWDNYACSVYKNNLLVSAISCMVTGVVLLAIGGYFFYLLSGATEPHMPVRVGVVPGTAYVTQPQAVYIQQQAGYPQQQQQYRYT
ncbi:uncharacterized protein LOC121858094 [Homarus americanus]|uniref:Uncharacterized protein n=1 Tax=Homarus americanus TaxID=6706 RepID=A0A8J5N9V4_HOMAM|nr:uncharacterized protein LOC121858094 [Homarus americanus]KAG7175539.1 hypothetical protein Hamer_G022078 [Homarus americanus]